MKMPNSIQSINGGTYTPNELNCTCNSLNKASRNTEEFNNVLTSTDVSQQKPSYSQLKYGLSNIPTGILSNVYSNIESNLNIRNDAINSQNNNTDSSVNVGNTVEVTNKNLSEKQQIEDAVKKASKKYGLDENLIKAVIKTESNFNPRVVSSAGAKGLMQIMPANFNHLGVTNPFDIYQNVDAGTKLLKEYINKYNGDVEMGLMAYNGGPTRMKKRGVTSIEHIYKMPKETQNYVKKVMKYYRGV